MTENYGKPEHPYRKLRETMGNYGKPEHPYRKLP